jgi:ubiquitin C-terminal hydrolase
VDYLTNPVCDEKQFTYYKDFKSMEIEYDTNKTTLLKCFEKFRQPEIITGNNQWLCPMCKTQRDA